jgi:hypothetical protein
MENAGGGEGGGDGGEGDARHHAANVHDDLLGVRLDFQDWS